MPYNDKTEPQALGDEALVENARAGDNAAFEMLVRRYERPLFNYARKILGNSADAEDVFQETCVRVYRHLRRFRRGARFRPWVYRITTNLCRDKLRARRRKPTVAMETPLDNDPDSATLGDTLPSDNLGADAAAREHETVEHLAAAVDRLPEKHRAVFLMARYQDLPYDEIAAALKIPVGTVKSRMHKAVNLLMDALEDLR